MNIDGFDVLFMHMAAGKENEARAQARMANLFVERNRHGVLMLSIDGFDDDPREIDQIPEGRRSLLTLYEELSAAALARLDPTHRGLLLVAAGRAYRQGTKIVLEDDHGTTRI